MSGERNTDPRSLSWPWWSEVQLLSCVWLFATPWAVAYQLLCPWDFPGNSPGVDCHFLLQGIFPTQGSNPGLLHCRQTLYRLSHQGSPLGHGRAPLRFNHLQSPFLNSRKLEKKITMNTVTAAAKSLQSCPTLCDPIDGSPPGSPVPGILQARTLEWVAISFSMHESEKWKGSRSVVSDPQRPHGLQPSRLLHPWDFPGKSTRVGCHHLSLIVFSAISLALEQKMFVVSLWDILAWGESKRGPDPLRKIQWTEPQNWNSTSFKCYLATWCPLSHTWSGVISSKIHLISLEHSR